MLQLSGEKMSKSIGNLVTIEEFLSRHPADALRMMVLNSGYRNPLSYSEEILAQAEKAIERLRSALKPAQAGAGRGRAKAYLTLCWDRWKRLQMVLWPHGCGFNSSGALGRLFDLGEGRQQTATRAPQTLEMEHAQTLIRKPLRYSAQSGQKPQGSRAAG